MLVKNPHRRADFPSIQQHEYFRQISWSQIGSRTLQSPFAIDQNNDYMLNFPKAEAVTEIMNIRPYTGGLDLPDFHYDREISQTKHDKIVMKLQQELEELNQKLQEKSHPQVIFVQVPALSEPNKVMKQSRSSKKPEKKAQKRFRCDSCTKAFAKKHHLKYHSAHKVCQKIDSKQVT